MWRSVIVIVVAIVVMVVFVEVTSDPKAEFQRSAPPYASAMTDSYSHNKCVVETANGLRAYRADFLSRAVNICDADRMTRRR